MDTEVVLIVLWIKYLIISKRHISNDCIKEIVRIRLSIVLIIFKQGADHFGGLHPAFSFVLLLTLMKGDKAVEVAEIPANLHLFVHCWHWYFNVHHLVFGYVIS